MPRNPKCDLVHRHNGFTGSVAMAKQNMQAICLSYTASKKAKELAYKIDMLLHDLDEEIRTNPQY